MKIVRYDLYLPAICSKSNKFCLFLPSIPDLSLSISSPSKRLIELNKHGQIVMRLFPIVVVFYGTQKIVY